MIKKLKAFSKEGLERSLCNLMIGAHQAPSANIIYINRILEVSHLRLRRNLPAFTVTSLACPGLGGLC